MLRFRFALPLQPRTPLRAPLPSCLTRIARAAAAFFSRCAHHTSRAAARALRTFLAHLLRCRAALRRISFITLPRIAVAPLAHICCGTHNARTQTLRRRRLALRVAHRRVHQRRAGVGRSWIDGRREKSSGRRGHQHQRNGVSGSMALMASNIAVKATDIRRRIMAASVGVTASKDA
jgi:hypothetical protein